LRQVLKSSFTVSHVRQCEAPMIDLNALAVFVAVVEAGSFTGGAKALGLPKGSVSRKISGLEASLGVAKTTAGGDPARAKRIQQNDR
jgi:hypothetical protein